MNTNHFKIEKKQLYYNNQKVFLGMPMENFVKIVNSEYRIARYAVNESVHKEWYWLDKKLHASTSTDKDGKEIIILKQLEIDEQTGDFRADWSDNSPKFPDYKTMEEVIKKYGKYDSLKMDENEKQERIFYVWDKLGFNASIEKGNLLGQINIIPILFTKTQIEQRLDEGLVPLKNNNQIHFTENILEIENYQTMLERHPRSEFKGKFTYDGSTADFSKIGYTDWKKMVNNLNISSSTYDPPGDSKGWGRKIWLDYDHLLVDVTRFNNEAKGSFSQPSAENVGKMDGVKSIEIFRFTDEDRK